MHIPDAPAVHSVYFYDSDASLIHRLVGIVSSALMSGNSALLVTTSEHAEFLRKQLPSKVFLAGERSRLTMLDAQETLSKFMVNGRPEGKLFEKHIGGLLDDMKGRARNLDHGLTVFGEMVAVLWASGNQQAAIELEELWNNALNDRVFYLHCAYPRRNFAGESDPSINAICERHTHSFGVDGSGM
jgi:hypothetical protein